MPHKNNSVLSLPWGMVIRILIAMVALVVLLMGGWTALELRANSAISRQEAYETFVTSDVHEKDMTRIQAQLSTIATDMKATRESVIRMEAKME